MILQFSLSQLEMMSYTYNHSTQKAKKEDHHEFNTNLGHTVILRCYIKI